MTRQRWLGVLRWVLYALEFLLALLLQTTVFGHFSPFGLDIKCVPVALGCICMQLNAESGGLFALLASLVWCLSGADYGSVQIITLTVVGVLSGGLCSNALPRRFGPAVAISLGALVLNEGVCFLLRLYLGSAAAAQALSVLAPTIGLSMLVCPFAYGLARLIGRIGRHAA